MSKQPARACLKHAQPLAVLFAHFGEGDIAIGVPTVERRARILSKIWEIEQEWVKVKFAADKILGGIRIPEYVDVISQKTDKQHQVLNDLLSEIVAHYSNRRKC